MGGGKDKMTLHSKQKWVFGYLESLKGVFQQKSIILNSVKLLSCVSQKICEGADFLEY